MKPAQSRDELLIELARAGEPLAFCTVFSDAMNKTYQSLINSGNSSEETARLFSSFARKTYRSFGRNQLKQPALEWYADQEKQHLSKFIKATEGEVAVESLIPEDGRFGRQLSLLIQREYGRLHRAERELSFISRVAKGFLKRPILVGLVFIFLIALIGIPIINYWWLKTGTRLIVKMESANRAWMISVPFTNRFGNPISPGMDSLQKDSLHDTIPAADAIVNLDSVHSDTVMPLPAKAIPKPLLAAETGKPSVVSAAPALNNPSKKTLITENSEEIKRTAATSIHSDIPKQDSLGTITAPVQALSPAPSNTSSGAVSRSTVNNPSAAQGSSNPIIDTGVQLR